MIFYSCASTAGSGCIGFVARAESTSSAAAAAAVDVATEICILSSQFPASLCMNAMMLIFVGTVAACIQDLDCILVCSERHIRRSSELEHISTAGRAWQPGEGVM